MRGHLSAALCVASLGLFAEWKPAPATISTPWGEKVSPENALREYPRPQFVRRGEWQDLNGLWDYAVLTDKDDFDTVSGPVRGPRTTRASPAAAASSSRSATQSTCTATPARACIR